MRKDNFENLKNWLCDANSFSVDCEENQCINVGEAKQLIEDARKHITRIIITEGRL